MNLKVEYIPLSEIKPYRRNAKLHPEEQIEQIQKSIQEFGFNDPIALWNDEIVEGHGRYFAAKRLKLDTVPIIRLDGLTDEQRRAYALVHNKLTMNSDFDLELLDMELDSITIDMEQFGFDLGIEEEEYEEPLEKGSLADRYLVPPFSVIYGNKKEWLDRKRGWVKYGIRSEIGREGGLCNNFSPWMARQSPVDGGQ